MTYWHTLVFLYDLRLVSLHLFIVIHTVICLVGNSTIYVVSDDTVEQAINGDVDISLVQHETSANEDVVSSACSRGQSSTSPPESAAHDKVHSSISEELHDPSQRQSRSFVVEDIPDTGRSRHAATSLAEDLPITGQSSNALSSVSEDAKTESISKSESRSRSHGEPEPDSGHSGKAEDIKSVSVSKSVEKSVAVRTQTNYDSNEESVVMEIDSEAKYVSLSLYITLASFLLSTSSEVIVNG